MEGEGRRAREGTLLVLLLLAVSVAGCGTKAKASPPPPPRVTVATVVKRDVPIYLEAVASLDGYVNVEIRARVRGVLEAQLYKDGAAVSAGQPLFSIDRSEYEAALASAKATLARAQTAAAHTAARRARTESIGAARVVSKQEVEDAQAAALDAEEQVRVAQAALKQATLNLGYTELRAPVAGIAGLAQVRIGNLVGQSEPTLLTTVSDVQPIRVNFPLSEVDYVKAAERLKKLDERDRAWAEARFAAMERGVELDDSLELLLADGTTYPRRGVIVAVNRQVDPTTGTIQLQALFPNPDALLRPGQFGRVRMRRADEGRGALLVPEASVIQVQGQASLAVVGPDARVDVRRVGLGPSVEGLRIVTSGVAAGERVVVEGVQKAMDGALVTAEPARPAARIHGDAGAERPR